MARDAFSQQGKAELTVDWKPQNSESPHSSQINHTLRFILSYECLALAWLVSCQLFLSYPNHPLPLGFYLSLFLDIFLSFLLCDWVPDLWCSPFLVRLFLVLFILPACWPRLSLLLPHYRPFISLLGPASVLDRQRITASQLIKCSINKSHTPGDNIPQYFVVVSIGVRNTADSLRVQTI